MGEQRCVHLSRVYENYRYIRINVLSRYPLRSAHPGRTSYTLMQLEELYRRARRQHGDLNRDVVHDLFVKFGNDLPSDAYLTTCIKHAKTSPAVQLFEVHNLDQPEDHEEQSIEITRTLNKAISNVRNNFTLEVDTFLECCVNSNYKTFSAYSGISVSVLRKICSFAQKKIQDEYKRLS